MPEYWDVIYKADADFGDLIAKALAARKALKEIGDEAKAVSASEVASSLAAQQVRSKDISTLKDEKLAYDTLSESARKAVVWTDFGGRDSMPAHLSDLQQELSWVTLLNRQKWLGFTSPQAAYAWRQLELYQAYLMNRARFGATSSGTGYTTPDQYLSYLQREYVAERDLSQVMKDRVSVYRDLADAYLGYAKALKGAPGLTSGTMGEALPGIQAYNNALVGLPDTVTTQLEIDDSAALGKLATYVALLKGIPQAESTSVTESQVLKAAYAAGGVPVPSALPQEEIEVSYTGPYMEQYAAIMAEVAKLSAMRADIPISLHLDESSLDVLRHLPVAGATVNVTEHLMPQGGAVGVGAGPPPETVAAWTALDAALAKTITDAHYASVEELQAAAAYAGSVRGVDGLTAAYQLLAAARAANRAEEAEDLQDAITDLEYTQKLAAGYRDEAAAIRDADAAATDLIKLHLQQPVLPLPGAAGGAGQPPVPPVLPGAPPPEEPSGSAQSAAAALNAEAAAEKNVGDAATVAAAKIALLQAAQDGDAASAAKWTYVLQQSGAAEKDAADKASGTTQALGQLAGGLIGATKGWAGLLTQVALFGGLTTVSVLHILIDAIIEFAIALGGAIIGVAALAAAVGIFIGVANLAQDTLGRISDRLKATYTAATATGQAIYPLTNSFDQLARVIRPEVWQLYGDALTLIGGKLGLIGTIAEKTGAEIDRLAAKFIVWFNQPSVQAGFQHLITAGIGFAKQFGQIFINLGQLIFRFFQAAQLTHVAEDLGKVIIALTGLATAIAKMVPAPILAVVLGLHALYLWGGLAATAVTALLDPLRALALLVGGISVADSALAKLPSTATGLERLKAAASDVAAGFGAMGSRITGAASAAKAAVAEVDAAATGMSAAEASLSAGAGAGAGATGEGAAAGLIGGEAAAAGAIAGADASKASAESAGKTIGAALVEGITSSTTVADETIKSTFEATFEQLGERASSFATKTRAALAGLVASLSSDAQQLDQVVAGVDKNTSAALSTEKLSAIKADIEATGQSIAQFAAQTSSGAGTLEKYSKDLNDTGKEQVALAHAAGASESEIANIAGAAAQAGGAAEGAAGKTGLLTGAFRALSGTLLQLGIIGAVVALGFLVDKIVTARDATQQWLDTMNKDLASTSLFQVIGKTTGDLATVTDQLTHAQGLNAQAIHELTGQQSLLSGQLGAELTHVGDISHAYGVTMPGALALLSTAGVKTSDLFSTQNKVWEAAQQQVDGLVKGYAAMGQGLTQLQGDVSVQLVVNSDQLKQMQTLNGAWDSFLGIVTGGESTFVKVQQDLQATTTAAQATGASMLGLNANSLTLRSAFISMIPDAGKVQDAIRTQSAVLQDGAAGSALLTRATRDLAAEMIPLAGNNAAARASIIAVVEQANPAIDTWTKLTRWVGPLGASGAAADLQNVLFKLVTPVSQLAQDAAKLTTTLQQDLNPAMAQAEFNALGGQRAFNTFATDLEKFGPGSQATLAAGKTVAEMLLSIDKNSTTAKDQFVAWAESMGLSAGAANKLWSQVSAGVKPLGDVRKGLADSGTAATDLHNNSLWADLGDRFKTNLRGMGDFFGHTLPDAFGTAGRAIGTFFAGPFTDFFTKTVPHIAGNVVTFFDGPFRTSVEGAWSHVWSALVSPVAKFTDDVKHAITSGFDSWWKTHGSAVEGIWNSVTGSLTMAWDNFTGGLKTAWTTFTSWFHGSGDITRFLRGSWDTFYSSAVAPVLEKIKGAWTLTFGALEAIAKTAFDLIAATLKTAWDAAMVVVKVAWDAAMLVLKIAWDTVVAIISVAIDVLTGHWKTAWTDVVNWFKQVINALWDFLKQGFSAFDNFFRQVWNNSIGFLKQLWNNWWSWFYTNIVNNGFGHFFTRTIPGWFDDFVNYAKNSWLDTWRNFQSDVLSPLTHFFTSTVPGWWNDFSRFAGNAAAGVGRAIVAAFKSALGEADRIINTPINFINNDILAHLPGSLHIPTLPVSFAQGGLTPGAAMRYVTGSVPGAGDEDGTHIIAMGGEYMMRKPARMALEQRYGRGFMNWLNQADTWLAAGSRGSPASQQMRPGVNYAAGGDVAAMAMSPMGMAPGGFVNPIGRGARPERVDMGVDYGGAFPLYALTSGIITSLFNSGWPGGAFVGLHMDSAPVSGGNYWYYAEDVNPVQIGVGSRVRAGQHIANATGGSTGIEVGFAAPPGTGNTMASATGESKAGQAHGDPGAFPTGWGEAASNLIASLGGPRGITSGQVQGGTPGIGGGLGAIWQSVEGLLDAAGTGLGDLIKPLGKFISGGAAELLKLARLGSKAIFDFIWDHTVQAMVDVAPGDTIPGGVGRFGASKIKGGIDNFLGGKDQTAQQQAATMPPILGAPGPVSGTVAQEEAYAASRLSAFGWGQDQMKFLIELWDRESGWNRFARNPSSGAYGIPQALPPSKMGAAANPPTSSASAQINWGLEYIKTRPGYGSPQAAWAHELSFGWYPHGGVVGGDGAAMYPFGGTVHPFASGGTALSDWAPLNTAVRSEMTAMDAIQRAKLPAKGPTASQRTAFGAWQKALWNQQLHTIGLGQHGAYQALDTNAFSPAKQTAGQWQAFTGDLLYLLKEGEGTGIGGGINPPGTPADSGHVAWQYLRGPWQVLLDTLRIANTRAQAAETQWGSQYSSVPLGPGGGTTNADSPEWEAAAAAMNTAVRTEMQWMGTMQAAHLPAKGPTMPQRHAYTDWLKALWSQQLKTVGLGHAPPGAYQAISDRLKAPGTITGGQWSAFESDLSYLTREEEGTGAGGINPPGTPRDSGYAPWKWLHPDWQTLLGTMRNAAAKTQTAQRIWGTLYGPNALPTTPGPGHGPPTTIPGGMVNVMPEAVIGGPAQPVFNLAPGTAGYGFAAGGGLDQVAGMFAGGLDPGGVMLPVVSRYGVPAALLKQFSGPDRPAGDYPRRLSEAAAGSRSGPAINFEQVTINNPQPQKPSDSIAHSTARLAFLAGRMS